MSKNIYVGNLSWSCSDDDMRDLFAQYGDVLSARVIEDRDTGRSRGFGFVEMPEGDAQKAIDALDGYEFMGRPLKVNEARPKERRPRW